MTFHDSCHIGRAGGVYEPPRDLIRAIPHVELVEMAHSLDAMPFGMGGLMHGVGHAPRVIREPMFKLMTPMLPVLFPRLLPGMMPKVLPHMIRLIEQRIPMPDYLRHQLPDLFPEVVDNVMPEMLPEIAPKYVPILFEHLRH